jgi:two-component system NtrC family sensor kinase
MASLFVIRGQDHGRHFALRGDSTTIGRDTTSQIHLNDSEVSRQHAKIIRHEDAHFEIQDCGSSNGTFVNSRSVRSAVLHSGDRVQLGRTLLIFTAGPDVQNGRSAEPVQIVAGPPEDLQQIRDRAESQLSYLEPQLPKLGPKPEPGGAVEESLLAGMDNGEMIYQVSQAISRTVDIPELLGIVLDLIFQWINCDRGCVMLLDDITGELIPSCSKNRKSSKQAGEKPLQISRTILDHVLQTRESILTSDAQMDDRWTSAASIAGLGVHEAICVPMLGRYGVQGVIYVDTKVSAGVFAARNGKCCFDHSHLKLLIAIAGQAALAIEDTQFYQAMLQSERLAAMGQTIADISHHVKNILQGISGGNFLVEDGLSKDNLEVIRRGWKIVKKNQDRISGLVLDMLTYSKDRRPEMQPSDLNQVVAEVGELMLSRARESGVNLQVNLLSSPLVINMDGEAIHRALLNVVTNAIDAAAAREVDQTPQSAPAVVLDVEYHAGQECVRINVTDNGPGISVEQQSRIFTPFFSSKGARGTGLGLPVSQKILREHGGDLTVHSNPGLGAAFVLSWPALLPPEIHLDDTSKI